MKKYQYHIFSPYRVCPLGAHVDHQHGLVTGFAINKGVDLWFNVNGSSQIDNGELTIDNYPENHVHLESKTFEGVVDFEINAPTQVREHHWGDYARGAKYALMKRFELKRGIDGVIQGSLPVGGLSSSAAVLIAYVMAFAKANDIALKPFEVVKIASEAEREYIGLNNGLLDQACIALSKKDQLLFLDCDSNEYRLIPFGKTPSGSPCLGGERPPQSPCLGGEKKSSLRREDLGGSEKSALNREDLGGSEESSLRREDLGGSEESALNREDLGGSLPFEIGIFFSGLTRSLVNSDYNLRVYECKTAAWNMLAYTDQPLKTFDKTFLRDIPKATFEKTRIAMPARFARRAEHFYSEYRRVRQGVTAWETGNMKLFGKLSFDSCESSIHNYECGSPELIAIYEIMRSLPGVYGGRFSGAGFKGACIALVDPAYKEDIQKVLTEKYLEQFPEYEKTFQVFWVKPDDGARFV